MATSTCKAPLNIVTHETYASSKLYYGREKYELDDNASFNAVCTVKTSYEHDGPSLPRSAAQSLRTPHALGRDALLPHKMDIPFIANCKMTHLPSAARWLDFYTATSHLWPLILGEARGRSVFTEVILGRAVSSFIWRMRGCESSNCRRGAVDDYK
jgi:hypothetical protein